MELLVALARLSPTVMQRLLRYTAGQHPLPPVTGEVTNAALAFAVASASGEPWTLVPDKARSPTGFVGLRNAGCTCYMYALYQQLFMIKKLRLVRTPGLQQRLRSAVLIAPWTNG